MPNFLHFEEVECQSLCFVLYCQELINDLKERTSNVSFDPNARKKAREIKKISDLEFETRVEGNHAPSLVEATNQIAELSSRSRALLISLTTFIFFPMESIRVNEEF